MKQKIRLIVNLLDKNGLYVKLVANKEGNSHKELKERIESYCFKHDVYLMVVCLHCYKKTLVKVSNKKGVLFDDLDKCGCYKERLEKKTALKLETVRLEF